jgi:hypothetical protein
MSYVVYACINNTCKDALNSLVINLFLTTSLDGIMVNLSSHDLIKYFLNNFAGKLLFKMPTKLCK